MDEREGIVTEAALASARCAEAAVEVAARANDDPAVAAALEEATVHAETTVSRLSWLRSVLRRDRG